MYSIAINDNVIKQTENRAVAWASYRAVARDHTNKSACVSIALGDTILHQKPADLLLLDEVDTVTTNDLLKITLARLGVDIKELKALVTNTELDLSNSRIDGWLRPSDDRKFVQLHNDEFAVILDALLASRQLLVKSPANIVKLRQQLGLTQSQLADKLGLKSGFRQVARWESGEQEMPDKRWQILQDFLK